MNDGKGMDCATTVPCRERPDGSQRQVPDRGGQEGQGEDQGCRMALAEPEAKVGTTTPPILKQSAHVQGTAKGYGALATVDTKTRGLSSEYLLQMPPNPDGCAQIRSLS